MSCGIDYPKFLLSQYFEDFSLDLYLSRIFRGPMANAEGKRNVGIICHLVFSEQYQWPSADNGLFK